MKQVSDINKRGSEAILRSATLCGAVWTPLHLHPYGVTKHFTSIQDMKETDDSKNDYRYPVRFWQAKNGVDWERVTELFADAFNNALF